LAENIKTLRRRIRTVANTMQVTRAMEMVSASKLRRAQSRLVAGRPYTQKIRELLARVTDSPNVGGNPLFEQRPGKALVVLVTADRGLAGSFNARLISEAESFLGKYTPETASLFLVGKKGSDYFRRHARIPVGAAITDLGGNLSSERSSEITAQLVELFRSGQYAQVYVIFAHFVSTIQSRPTVVKFLPLDRESLAEELGAAEEKPQDRTEYLFEPSPQAVFDRLVPAYLSSRIFMILAENFTSEHSARMVSMSNATRNCEDMLYDLTLRRNKARQTSITTEMLEIVGGANALT